MAGIMKYTSEGIHRGRVMYTYGWDNKTCKSERKCIRKGGMHSRIIKYTESEGKHKELISLHMHRREQLHIKLQS